MSANDRPQVTKKGHEHGNTGQSGGLKLMTGVGQQHTSATKIWFGKARTHLASVHCRITTARRKPALMSSQDAPASTSAKTSKSISICRRAILCSSRLSSHISKLI